MLQVSTTFDGSWHKRCHKSNFGVDAGIDVDTGLISDYEVYSKICFKCNTKVNKMKRGEITAIEYVVWLGEHDDCDENYDGFSRGMEAVADVAMGVDLISII